LKEIKFMNSAEIRKKFLDYFEKAEHKIVQSSPIVVKDDPTLLFTNAGMNQFKDFFLGNEKSSAPRIANTQKCLRVSGKHNDLEEVGVDHYHHTMFEMLGNWSFGDYFKEEAIYWAWTLLTEVYKLDQDRLYVTVFEGDKSEKLEFDVESQKIWHKYIAANRILKGNKKDNFWEMGDTGPCGPCSEIHIDLRPDNERKEIQGASLVNKDHEQVIELWNLVFMEFNRKADGTLEPLPQKHVDTGMGFERLCRVIQGKNSNYDTDLFQPVIQFMEKLSGKTYGKSQSKQDIAFRVIADHIRAVSFVIADGQLPSNTGAGYVARRILRRAIRYGFSFLDVKEPFMNQLVEVIAKGYGNLFPELSSQTDFISKVIMQEEVSFLKTLDRGLTLLKHEFENSDKKISGKTAFELYDTFGFPIDLTQLIAHEEGLETDMTGFHEYLKEQQNRSRKQAERETGDWVELIPDADIQFVGYDTFSVDSRIVKYRTLKNKGKDFFQIVLKKTPFYPEGGGQVGDTGTLKGLKSGQSIQVLDTIKENNLIIHVVSELPKEPNELFEALIDIGKRKQTAANHSATHLLHAALRNILGTHVAQKGSLVNPDYLRFDFSHFEKVTDKQLEEIETLVNQKILEQIPLNEEREVPIQQAINKGAIALFGEKYGDKVRMIVFDNSYSVELCGGTHVQNTADIALFKITAESSVGSGIRRIEAISGVKALEYYKQIEKDLLEIRNYLGQPYDIKVAKLMISNIINEYKQLKKQQLESENEKTALLKQELKSKVREINGIKVILEKITLPSSDKLKRTPKPCRSFGCRHKRKTHVGCFRHRRFGGK
jgi:alanyl-tRNA synthetase